MARWGREYIDPKSFQEPTGRDGQSLGVKVFKAYTCEFGLHRPTANGGKLSLTLTVDLRAKVLRNKSLLDTLCDGRNPNNCKYSQRDMDDAQRTWKSEVVICKYDKRCYSVIELDFKHSPASLPVEGQNMSHAEYFQQRKGITLEYPNAKPMVAVLGRNQSKIYLPAEQ
eukprot:15361472-Ditylum_brightwellii.AAC.1